MKIALASWVLSVGFIVGGAIDYFSHKHYPPPNCHHLTFTGYNSGPPFGINYFCTGQQ